MSPSVRRTLSAAVLAVAAAGILFALHQLAAILTASHLSTQAAHEWSRIEAGRPLWQWRLRQPDDVVAGRAFGHASLRSGDQGLKVTSGDGTLFELGLPAARGLDLAHWPWLVLRLQSQVPARLSLVWQASSGATCLSNTPVLMSAPTTRIDLRGLSWLAVRNGPCNLPTSAQMLRLRLTMPAHAQLSLDSVALERTQPAPPYPPAPNAALSSDPDRLDAVLAHVAASNAAWPLLLLPSHASAEQMLAIRDRVAAERPAALLVGGTRDIDTPAQPPPAWAVWAGAGAYAATLGFLAVRRRRGWLPLVASSVGPLWLIAGLQWGLQTSAAATCALASALVFAGYTQWRDRPTGWHWLGSWRSPAWWLPVLLVPVAVLVGLLFGHAFEPISARRGLVYLAWALLQQWLILGFFLTRLEPLLADRRWAVLIAALLFALLHTPNGVLMQLCFLAELWLGWCFLRTRSLLPIALAHAASALLVGASLVGGPLRSLEVSARFFF